jgi:hypothetical protein
VLILVVVVVVVVVERMRSSSHYELGALKVPQFGKNDRIKSIQGFADVQAMKVGFE